MSKSKKIVAVALCLGLVGGALAAPASAGKKKKPKPKPPALVQVEQKMFLVGEGCVAEDRGLSVTDTADVHTCAYAKGGAIAENAPEDAPGGTPWQTWPAIDGVPLKLDATKPVTAEISTAGLFPLVGDYPGISAGTVKITIRLFGETGGEEKLIAEGSAESAAKPGDTSHTAAISVNPDVALDGAEFTSLVLHTRIGGASAGEIFYKLDNPSSFVSIPTWGLAQ
ncbi:MAG TPA: hypothetical protein VG318_00815 [Actinomycetota bacterium]|nr:hypothetical protein [Actinomycetota bacterium]